MTSSHGSASLFGDEESFSVWSNSSESGRAAPSPPINTTGNGGQGTRVDALRAQVDALNGQHLAQRDERATDLKARAAQRDTVEDTWSGPTRNGDGSHRSSSPFGDDISERSPGDAGGPPPPIKIDEQRTLDLLRKTSLLLGRVTSGGDTDNDGSSPREPQVGMARSPELFGFRAGSDLPDDTKIASAPASRSAPALVTYRTACARSALTRGRSLAPPQHRSQA
jgi:hypothetical protein